MDLLLAGLTAAALVAAFTADLLLWARVWRPFAGGVRVWTARVARPFGTLEIGMATACALVVALPAALTAGRAAEPLRAPSSAAVVLLPAVALYAIWVGAVAFCARSRGQRTREAFFAGTPSQRPLASGLGLGLAMVVPVLAVSVFSFWLCGLAGLGEAPQDVFALLREPSLRPVVRLTIIGVAVVGAPLAEEFLFRGLLFPALLARSGSFSRALILQALLFGAIHAHLPTFLPLSAAGVCFALGYAATGTLLTPIIMHMVFNACSILLFFAF